MVALSATQVVSLGRMMLHSPSWNCLVVASEIDAFRVVLAFREAAGSPSSPHPISRKRFGLVVWQYSLNVVLVYPREQESLIVCCLARTRTLSNGDRGPKLRCFSSQTTDQPASQPASRLLLTVVRRRVLSIKTFTQNGNPLQSIVQPPKDGQHRLPGCMISTALPSLGRFFRDFLESGTQNKNYYSFPTFGYSLSVGSFGQFAAMVLCVIEAGCFFSP